MVAVRLCPECGAELTDHPRCWLCYTAVAEVASIALPASAQLASPWQFGLSSLMVTMTLVAVLAGVTVAYPGIGIALMVVATPALARTVFEARRGRRSGRPLSRWQKAATFLATALFVAVLVATAGIAAALALFIACAGVSFGGRATGMNSFDAGALGLILGVPLCLAAGIAVAWWIWRVSSQRPWGERWMTTWQSAVPFDQAKRAAFEDQTIAFWNWLYINVWTSRFIPWTAHGLSIIALLAWLLFYSPHVPDADGRTVLLVLAITALGLALLRWNTFIPFVSPITLAAGAAPLVAFIVVLPLQNLEWYFTASVVARLAAIAAAIGMLKLLHVARQRFAKRGEK